MISSTANKRVKQIMLWQTKARERKTDGVFIAEGIKMFEEAPPELVREVYFSTESLGRLKREPALWGKLQKLGAEEVTEEVFRRMSDTDSPQGILTVLRQPEYELQYYIEETQSLFLVLEDIQDPGNLGTLVRTAEGAGATGVILAGNTADLFNPKTVRATMGSIYRVPCFRMEQLSEGLKLLHENGVTTYAAALEESCCYDEIQYEKRCAFLIGNEGKGLKDQTIRMAEKRLKIPMEGRVESLNASVAGALLMYEVHRQRKRGNKV